MYHVAGTWGGSRMPGPRRRELIALLGGAAASALPATGRGQPATPVVGYLATGSRESEALRLPFFHEGLIESGYVEGQNLGVEYRWANHQYDRLPELAADLVRRRVAVIATSGGPASALAAKAATATIPIVFVVGADPVKLGLVASLARRGATSPVLTFLRSSWSQNDWSCCVRWYQVSRALPR